MSTARILLVEDDAFTGKMMELQFRKHDFDIALAHNGDEALELLAHQSFDLVLTDVLMPGISGIDLVRKVRGQTRPEGHLPIILLTALGDAKNILEGIDCGADDFLAKTNEFGIILAKVRHHLEVAALRSASSSQRSGPDGTWVWNLAANEMQYSATYHSLLGLENKALGTDPKAWLELVHPDDRAAVTSRLETHLARRAAHFEADFRMRHPRGQWAWFHAFGLASFAKEGQAVRMIGSLSRLTAAPHQALEAGLQQLQVMLSGLPGTEAATALLNRLRAEWQAHKMATD